MVSLITVEDVAARLGRPVSEEEIPQVQSYIDDVSALIIDACGGRDFQFHENETIALAAVRSTELPIPWKYQPTHSVEAVRFNDDEPVDDWFYSRWALHRCGGWFPAPSAHSQHISVQLTYGYKDVPAAIKAITAQEVVRWMSMTPGISQEKVGDLEVHYGSTAQTLSSSTRADLKKYRRRITSLSLRR